MQIIDVSIIIVSYNTKELLVKCVKSIIDTVKKTSYEIIIVDNNSEDDSAQAVKKSFDYAQDKVFVIKNSENFGFSKANNIGVTQSRGQYVLFLNPDTVVYEKTVDRMVEFMDNHKDAGAATCFVELPNGQLDDAAHRGFPTPWRALCHFSGFSKIFPRFKWFAGYSLGWMNLSETHVIDSCAGAFMMVRREAGEKAGWWDEDYFWYGEDLDFCYRLKDKGWKIYFMPQFRILHYKGVSGGIKKHSQHLSTADKETRLRATKARFEAMKIFYAKHYSIKYPKIITWFVLFGINTKSWLTQKSA